MRKPELLAPAGNMESLISAINNGADAIYLAGKNYGARAYADNFTNEEIIKAIKYAHLYNVKVYVSANTLIFENEVQDFINYLKFLYLNGVDAVIMQDIGMISLIKKLIPSLEVHASTQCHNNTDESLMFFKTLNITRAVLARELTLEEINNMKTNIEKEVFVYGALCICYSGCCLMSFSLGGRSGNRGECAGPCRQPYTLLLDGQEVKTSGNYLLSTRELNTLPKLKELLNSNIQSLKIEGRMKSPEYVGYVTSVFRHLIDNQKIDNYETNLKKLYNRTFTTGHLFKDSIVNKNSSGHQGIKIGKILENGKYIKVKLTSDLNQNDGVRFLPSNKGMMVNKLYNNKKLLINKANANDIVYLDNKLNIKNDTTLIKTYDYKLNEEIKKVKEKKLPITYEVKAKVNEPLKIKMTSLNITSTYIGNIVNKAINSPITKENIIKHLSKIGNYPFYVKNINITSDNNIFIPVKELNEAKRYLMDNIIKEKTVVRRTYNFNFERTKVIDNKKEISVLVNNEEQLKFLINKVDRIYTENFNLYEKYKNDKVYYRLNRYSYHLPDLKNENLLVTTLGQVYKYHKDNNIISDYTLNVTNSFSVNLLDKYQVKKVTISVECNKKQVEEINKYTPNIEVLVYGCIENMILNYCLIKENLGCSYCKHDIKIKNKFGEEFPVISNNCHNKILNYKQVNNLDNIPNTSIRLDFYNESITDIEKILNKVKTLVH